MAEVNTLARPYANAVFDLAEAAGNLREWSEVLSLLAELAGHPDLRRLLGNPLVSGEQLAALIEEVCGEKLSEEGRNLVSLLVQRRRFELAPAISELYDQRRDVAEERVVVDVHSAVELSQHRKDALAQTLKMRLQRDVEMNCVIDPEIIGGVMVQSGDMVIDHSVRAQLHQLRQAIDR